jgi:hypothetical protein
MDNKETNLAGLTVGEVMACSRSATRCGAPAELQPKLRLATVERITPKRAILHPHEYGHPITIELETGRERSAGYCRVTWRRATPQEIAETEAALADCKRWSALASWLLDFRPMNLPNLRTMQAMRAAFDAEQQPRTDADGEG